jgi:uncharacterized membrane protein
VTERLVARVLLVGGVLGIAVIVLGLGLYASQGGFRPHVLRVDRPLPGEPGVFVSIRQVVDGMRRHPVDPLAVSALGLVLLMATPGLAVAVAIPAFVAARDFRYAGIASLVLAMLLVSLLLSGAIH